MKNKTTNKMVDKTLHRKLMFEQHELHLKKLGVNYDAHQGKKCLLQ